MTAVKIDKHDDDHDTMSADAMAQLGSMQFGDAGLQRLASQTAALQTARIA